MDVEALICKSRKCGIERIIRNIKEHMLTPHATQLSRKKLRCLKLNIAPALLVETLNVRPRCFLRKELFSVINVVRTLVRHFKGKKTP